MDPIDFIDDIDELDKLAVLTNKTKVVTDEPSKTMLNDPLLEKINQCDYHWLYSARADYWWLFSPDDNEKIETAYEMGLQEAEITMSNGYKIKADFVAMVQTTDTGNFRDLKRVDKLTKSIKLRGVAGKYYNSEQLSKLLT